MAIKNYKEYCREAITRFPKTYRGCFNEDGSIKRVHIASMFSKTKVLKDIPKCELKKLPMDGWREESEYKEIELEVNSTEIKTKIRKNYLTPIEMPKSPALKEYKRIWMHNSRVNKRIRNLKEKYGTSESL